MDFYYDEAQMNKWRDSCIKGQESLRNKVDRFDKESASAKTKQAGAMAIGNLDEVVMRDSQKLL